MAETHFTAIILAGGSGSRMGGKTAKQYIVYREKPLLYYALKAFEDSDIDDIVLVCRLGDESFCRQEIVDKYGLKKVKNIVTGGKERYDSVYAGLLTACCDYVFIHDGARVCISTDVISRCMEDVVRYDASIAAVPVKDTIKMADSKGFVKSTPERNLLWQVQTPQCFSYAVIRQAYDKMLSSAHNVNITDDAMVLENFGHTKIHLTMGSYSNIKVTTPEDLQFLEGCI
ncbi:MAG: 2-C-methyl-D-erythritol 4-phosphate cytidylyltransferase [Lachnospiraceae bacterium]